jgi:hypothetical protein
MAEWIFRVEQAGIAILLLLSVATTFAIPAGIKRLTRRVARLGRCRPLAVVSVGLVAAVVAATISLIRAPAPIGHDEQSYLLAADTFARGRLTNPTHPMWRHFESFHIIQQPTYASKYPPGQGMVLALGQVITGDPTAGLWLSTGLAAAAVCWMLGGWVPPRWALLGGGLVVFHVFIQLAWGQSFWGGDVALIGGALVYGALPRIVRHARPTAAAAMGLGLVLLANSRPYEGLIAGIPAGLALIVWLVGAKRPPLRTALGRVVLPLTAVLAAGGAATAFYNAAVTGDALTMPYQVHEQTYAVAPVLLCQSPRPEPTYRHELQRWAYTKGALFAYRQQQTLTGLLKYKGPRIVDYTWFLLLRPTLVIPLVTLPWILRRRWAWFVLAALAVAVAGSIPTTWLLPHYLAAAVPLVLLLVVEGIRRLRCWTWKGRPCGRTVVWGLGLLYILVFGLSVRDYVLAEPTGIARYRPQVLAQLDGLPGRHLVVVRYGPEHSQTINDEWVYNAADIDAAKVVWAREMDPAEDRELLGYFRDRQIWLLLADAQPPRLLPYPRAGQLTLGR